MNRLTGTFFNFSGISFENFLLIYSRSFENFSISISLKKIEIQKLFDKIDDNDDDDDDDYNG